MTFSSEEEMLAISIRLMKILKLIVVVSIIGRQRQYGNKMVWRRKKTGRRLLEIERVERRYRGKKNQHVHDARITAFSVRPWQTYLLLSNKTFLGGNPTNPCIVQYTGPSSVIVSAQILSIYQKRVYSVNLESAKLSFAQNYREFERIASTLEFIQ